MFVRLLSKLFAKREEAAGPKGDGDVVKPFLDHLEDLRWTIIKMAIVLIVGMVGCFVFAHDLVKILQWPIHWADIKVESLVREPSATGTAEGQIEMPPVKNVTTTLIDRMATKGVLSAEEAGELMAQARQEAGIAQQNQARVDAAEGSGVEIRAPSPFNAIMAAIQLSFYAAITVTLPLLMYILGDFVMPALTKRERTYIIPALGVGFLLFLGGVLFCFTQILPGMLKFLHAYTAKMEVKDMWDLKTYCAFVAHLCIAFGLLCELPVLMVTLNFIGVVNYKMLAKSRAYAFTGILVLCAIVSPSPDLATLFMLAGPIALLYELCIWIVYFLDKRRERLDRKLADEDDRHPHEPID